MLIRGVMSETGKEEAMRERWKKIRTGTLTIAFIIIGILEYGALMKYFDLPQVMLIVPLIGAASYIFLKKSCLTVFGCTALCSALYQLVAGDANAIARLQTNAVSIAIILFQCLIVLLILEAIGIGGGALICLSRNRDKKSAVRITACILGVLVTVGPYLAIYHNPLYPLTARIELNRYVEENLTDYPIANKMVYYSLPNLNYECRVAMSDGKIRIVGYDIEGKISEQ